MVKMTGEGVAPFNIALIKYWGKRNVALNLPLTSSLSLSLNAYTHTVIQYCEGEKDVIILNEEKMDESASFYKRSSTFLNPFRSHEHRAFRIETRNDLPTGAGLASSASGFCALVMALNKLFEWNLSQKQLSILARKGSGSAARSITSGFVLWHKGEEDDGSDSFGEKIAPSWEDLRVGVVIVDRSIKHTSSRNGMLNIHSSPFATNWPSTVENDLTVALRAIKEQNFEALGKIAENNSFAMHSLMMSMRPRLPYFKEQTWSVLTHIQELQKKGIQLYTTMDAGPNVKILFLRKDQDIIQNEFPDIRIFSME